MLINVELNREQKMDLKDLIGIVATRLITGEKEHITAVNELLKIQKKLSETK